MSALAKVFVVFVFLLSVTFFGTSSTLYLTREDWAKNYEEAVKARDAKAEELAQRIKDLKEALDLEIDARKAITSSESTLASRLDAALGDIKQLNTDIKKVERERDDAQAQKAATDQMNAAVVSENTQLKTQLQSAHDARAQATQLQKVANQERFRMKTELDTSQRELRDARVSYNEMSQEFESLELVHSAVVKKLGKDGLEALISSVVAPPVDALIEEVDADLRLVVLSVGKQDNVKEGFEFTVYRDDQFVGKVRVHKVYENLAGAKVLFTADSGEIRKGDRATTRIN